jgi:hypothetical protein
MQKGDRAMAEKRRVNVDFSEETYQVLLNIAERRGATLSEVLRGAVGLEKWYEDTKREGARVLVERAGTIREVVRP